MVTLENIKDTFKRICTAHKQIQLFNYGEEYILDDVEEGRLNQAFLEIPYQTNLELDNNRFKTHQFALLILFPSMGVDGIIDDHKAISACEVIGDAILTRFKAEAALLGVLLESVNGVSIRNLSDADLSGMRYELTIKVFRSFCNGNYQDQFSDLS